MVVSLWRAGVEGGREMEGEERGKGGNDCRARFVCVDGFFVRVFVRD